MHSTRTSRNRVPDTPKWMRTKKLLAAMSESMDTAPIGVRRTNYEFRCGGAIGMLLAAVVLAQLQTLGESETVLLCAWPDSGAPATLPARLSAILPSLVSPPLLTG